ncbi:hypothetical protein ACN26Y_09515 [Micromonospora sp. WMMD558]|uniref:hypothetical protein n=1 Tax=unclassified Micromonospora TaxID=2617518 RepID=UPI0012B488D7|nr:hypothetical protein [Micromonospora sp. WMMC415]QGN46506.1 hypothetical protein GKC29_06430 [Micromonospora sp. WMMC415]
MDAGAAARSRATRADPGYRLRGAVLAVAALALLAAGGAWWTARAPALAATAAGDGSRTAAGPPGRSVILDPRTGIPLPVADPATGRLAPPGWPRPTPGTVVERVDDPLPSADVVWRGRATITPDNGLIRRSYARDGDRYLLQFRCTGPGELLIVIDGARYAGPLTSGCGGPVTTATEVTGVGGPVQISLSTVNEQPVRVEAQLVALS